MRKTKFLEHFGELFQRKGHFHFRRSAAGEFSLKITVSSRNFDDIRKIQEKFPGSVSGDTIEWVGLKAIRMLWTIKKATYILSDKHNQAFYLDQFFHVYHSKPYDNRTAQMTRYLAQLKELGVVYE